MSTYVLIHGAGDSAFYWHRVEPLLRERGYDVVTVTLPADDDTAGLDAYVRTVLDAIGDRADLVVVGQSLGGFTAGQIAAHREVDELIYVNAMIPAAGEAASEWWDNTGHDVQFGDDLVAVFLQLTPPEIVEEAWHHVRNQSATAMRDRFPTGVPVVPTRFIQAADDRFFPAAWMRGVVRDRLGIEPVEIGGDHCVALSNPADLVEAITA